MGYFYTCPVCGASLDPGERCSCQAGDLPRRSERSIMRPLPDAKARITPGKLSPAAATALERIKEILKD